jgi:hypothetical protein
MDYVGEPLDDAMTSIFIASPLKNEMFCHISGKFLIIVTRTIRIQCRDNYFFELFCPFFLSST